MSVRACARVCDLDHLHSSCISVILDLFFRLEPFELVRRQLLTAK